MRPPKIDLYSDTQTRPSPGMREAMARAVVGDEQADEDPTTLELCRRVANLLGMEASLLLPSGTMCNLVAVLLHVRPGGEIIVDEGSHLLNTEAGGAAAVAGASIRPVRGQWGVFTPDELRRAIRRAARTAPLSTLVVAEQTTFSAGAVWQVRDLHAIRDAAHDHGLRTHLDGARLLNAAVVLGATPQTLTEGWDSAWLDLTKGLGCPVGALLCGSSAFIQEAWRWKQRLGGAMRQSGVLATAGLYALDHHVDRLRVDHENAALLYNLLSADKAFLFEAGEPQSNIVRFSLDGLDADDLERRCAQAGVRVRALNQREVRATMHLDVSRMQVTEAARTLREAAVAARREGKGP